MGASAALAGTAMTSGCVRKGVQHILPYTNRPENLIPGEPLFYRTSWAMGDSVLGLHVESQDGRPTKVEVSPDHAMSGGASNGFAQATVLDMYDPDRLGNCEGDQEKTWEEAWQAFDTALEALRAGQSAGLAILLDGQQSPTRRRLLQAVATKLPERVYQHDWATNTAARQGLDIVGLAGHTSCSDAKAAKVILALDSDAFSTGDGVRFSHGYAAARMRASTDDMNRLYAVEGRFSMTGANADNRLRVPSSHVGEFLRTVAGYVAPNAPAPLKGEITNRAAAEPGGLAHDARFEKFARAVADDLMANKGASLVTVGERQPGWVHGLAHFVNQALGNVGKTVFYVRNAAPATGTLQQLVADIQSRTISTLVSVGVNPAYDAPADLKFTDTLKTVGTSFTFSASRPTNSTWALPELTILKPGVTSSRTTERSVCSSRSSLRCSGVFLRLVLNRIVGNAAPNGQMKSGTLAGRGASSDAKWLPDGHSGIAATGKAVTPVRLARSDNGAEDTGGADKTIARAMEIVLQPIPRFMDVSLTMVGYKAPGSCHQSDVG